MKNIETLSLVKTKRKKVLKIFSRNYIIPSKEGQEKANKEV